MKYKDMKRMEACKRRCPKKVLTRNKKQRDHMLAMHTQSQISDMYVYNKNRLCAEQCFDTPEHHSLEISIRRVPHDIKIALLTKDA